MLLPAALALAQIPLQALHQFPFGLLDGISPGKSLHFGLVLGSHHQQRVDVVLDNHLFVLAPHLFQLSVDLLLLTSQHFLQFTRVSLYKISSGFLILVLYFQSLHGHLLLLQRKDPFLDLRHYFFGQSVAESVSHADIFYGFYDVCVFVYGNEQRRIVELPTYFSEGFNDTASGRSQPYIGHVSRVDSDQVIALSVMANGDGLAGDEGGLVGDFVGWVREGYSRSCRRCRTGERRGGSCGVS